MGQVISSAQLDLSLSQQGADRGETIGGPFATGSGNLDREHRIRGKEQTATFPPTKVLLTGDMEYVTCGQLLLWCPVVSN